MAMWEGRRHHVCSLPRNHLHHKRTQLLQRWYHHARTLPRDRRPSKCLVRRLGRRGHDALLWVHLYHRPLLLGWERPSRSRWSRRCSHGGLVDRVVGEHRRLGVAGWIGSAELRAYICGGWWRRGKGFHWAAAECREEVRARAREIGQPYK